jgi:dUTP pyrophosphatase
MVKRFYKVGEFVWAVAEKTKAKVVSLDVPNLSVRISIRQEDGSFIETAKKFMEIDKLKEKKVATASVRTQSQPTQHRVDTVLFAKVRETAIIPSKRLEDAGYDIYADFEGDELRLIQGEANLVPTGIASSLLPKYFFSLQHERGSSGKWGMLALSGCIDSGYRGEWFVNIAPTKYDVVISKTYAFPVVGGKKKAVLDNGVVYYPADQAIVQAVLHSVPNVRVKEITYEQLKAIPSERGDGKLGSSSK